MEWLVVGVVARAASQRLRCSAGEWGPSAVEGWLLEESRQERGLMRTGTLKSGAVANRKGHTNEEGVAASR